LGLEHGNGAGHTRDFDDLAAWLAVRTSKSAVRELLRIAWRTVGSIVARVNADIDAGVDRLDGLRRIGIDEISYKRGHRYLIVVVDHDTGRLVWAGPARNDTALGVLTHPAHRADDPRIEQKSEKSATRSQQGVPRWRIGVR